MTTASISHPNPVVKCTVLKDCRGWVVREYANGVFDATNTRGVGLSPGEDSFEAAAFFAREGFPKPREA